MSAIKRANDFIKNDKEAPSTILNDYRQSKFNHVIKVNYGGAFFRSKDSKKILEEQANEINPFIKEILVTFVIILFLATALLTYLF